MSKDVVPIIEWDTEAAANQMLPWINFDRERLGSLDILQLDEAGYQIDIREA